MPSFRKILIANRGEIAVRVARTCRAIGIIPVAVYSDADIRSPHVKVAEEAIHIGPSPVTESYLRIDKIIEAALRVKADAIHPGYGFLSENAELVAACEKAGLTFVGPSEQSVRMMGLKSTARQVMAQAGIPVVPGYDESDPGPDRLRAAIIQIGFPVLVKASAGGGGRGMRVVREISEIDQAVESARREAETAFGDGSLLVEKLIENAKHIEFQIIGDRHGKLLHLFERDCSAQRRHQKIVEESPSPAMTRDLRRRMGDAAVAAANAIGYYGVGTVEFLLGPSGEFYFIEVNTRLQVEHPVTEMVTGLDLVRLQIEIAEGKPIPFQQDAIQSSGHAIEARLYAENPNKGFLPAIGTICDWIEPALIDGLRVDSGVECGFEIGIYYDSLLAKVIAHAADRDTALRKLIYGLRSLSVQGVITNRDFLIRLLEHDDFYAGNIDTTFVERRTAELNGQGSGPDCLAPAIAATLFLQSGWRAQNTLLSRIPPAYRNNPYRDRSVKLRLDGDDIEVAYRHLSGEGYLVSCGKSKFEAQVLSFDEHSIRLSLDGFQCSFRVIERGNHLFVQGPAISCMLERVPRYPEPLSGADLENASTSMPGRVLKILVVEGQQVSVGDPLVILEAMKIEQTIKSSLNGFVESIRVKTGDIVGPGEILVHIAPEPA